MNTDLVPFLSFVIITTFTPGPNNISSASMGILYGFKISLPYLLGITVGQFLVLLFSGLISARLLIFPNVGSILQIVGALYILWLAYHTLKASCVPNEEQQAKLGFSKGILFQFLNPKVIFYGITLYTTFLGGFATNPLSLFVSASILMGVSFCALSSWTLFGSTIRTYLNRPRLKQALNTVFALLLVYTAVEISGLLELVFS